MRRALVGFAVLVLTGCVKPMEVSSITEIKPGPGATGFDVYAARRQTGEQVPAFAGEQLVEVRSFKTTEDGAGVQEEMAGAACEVRASNFSADVVTPAKVRVPIYRQASSVLSVACRKDGFAPKMESVSVVNVSRSQRYAMGGSGGVIGIAVALTADAMADPNADNYNYPLARIVMTPVAAVVASKKE